MMRLKPSTSTEMRVRWSGERQMRAMFERFWNGSVWLTLVVRLTKLSLFPTGLSRIWS